MLFSLLSMILVISYIKELFYDELENVWNGAIYRSL